MTEAKIALITEEAKSFGAQVALAEEIYTGSFTSIKSTMIMLRERGMGVDLLIITTRYGLIPGDRVVEQYAPDPRKLSSGEFVNKLSEGIGQALEKYRTFIIIVSTDYALALAKALGKNGSLALRPVQSRVFVVSGSKGAEVLRNAFSPIARQVTTYTKPGVARITNNARRAILNALATSPDFSGPG